MWANGFAPVPGKVHLLPAWVLSAPSTAAFSACVQWRVWDNESYIGWFGSQHRNWSTWNGKQSNSISACLHPEAPRERMVAICKPALFALRDGGHGLVRRSLSMWGETEVELDGPERGSCVLQDLELTGTADLRHITILCVRLHMPRQSCRLFF